MNVSPGVRLGGKSINVRDLTPKELDFIHWRTLAMMLPAEGVNQHFRTERARQKRLIAVRWPDGPFCPRCSKPDPTWVGARSVFQCRTCRHQFSITAGTLMHRSRLSLGTWFRAAEAVVLNHSPVRRDYQISIHELAAKLQVEYVAAFRTRKLVLAELQGPVSGFLRSAICVRSAVPPADIAENSEQHLAWLLEQD